MRLAFAKYEGLGNDFLVVDLDEHAALRGLHAAEAARLCDRHLGVGGDGVLLLSTASGRARMQVINADGSVPEMCGNGIRCVALHLARKGRAGAQRFEIDTDSGPHACRVLQNGESGVVEVSMRAPSLLPADVPVIAEAPLLDAPLQLDGETLQITCVSMGNPHAVSFTEVGERRVTLAPRVQNHAWFPRGANVGFARVLAPQVLELAVFERGSGWTRACGTGACAAAVAAVETGRAKRHEPIEVRLPGGPLAIVVGDAGQRLSMTGPARHVFDGVTDL
jgi:diaminopimelate epimerase